MRTTICKNEDYKRLYFESEFHKSKKSVVVETTDDINSFVDLEIAYPEKAKRLRQRLCGVSGCECHITIV